MVMTMVVLAMPEVVLLTAIDRLMIVVVVAFDVVVSFDEIHCHVVVVDQLLHRCHSMMLMAAVIFDDSCGDSLISMNDDDADSSVKWCEMMI